MIRNYKQFELPQAAVKINQWLTMAEGGCGQCTLADIVDVRPEDVAYWMNSRGYIYRDQGTIHEAIVPTLNHYGVNGRTLTPGYVNGVMQSGYFEEAYNHVAGGKCAVFLMGGLLTNAGGQCRNSYWTNAGHYICICGADDAGRLLVHDPASYARDGWHSIRDYSGNQPDSFNGNIKKIWLTGKAWKSGGNTLMAKIEKVTLGNRGGSVLLMQKLLRLKGIRGGDGQELKLDGDCGTNTVAAINAYQTIRRAEGVELGTDGKNDGFCGLAMWRDLLPGISVE